MADIQDLRALLKSLGVPLQVTHAHRRPDSPLVLSDKDGLPVAMQLVLPCRLAEVRDAINALPDLLAVVESAQPAAPAQPQGNAEPVETAVPKLRAMVENYHRGHVWDDLDARVCMAAVREIEALRAAPAQPQGNAEPVAWDEWRRVLAEKVDGYIQAQADDEGDEDAYADLKQHILSTPFAPPPAPAWQPPEGWTLVPLEPTTKMIDMGMGADSNAMHRLAAYACYLHMIAAAPPAPEPKR